MIALTMPGIIAMTILGGHLGFAVLWLSAAWILQARALRRRHPAAARVEAPALA